MKILDMKKKENIMIRVKQVFQDKRATEIFVVYEDGSSEISNKNNETLYKMGKEITDLFLLDIKEENSTYTKVGK